MSSKKERKRELLKIIGLCIFLGLLVGFIIGICIGNDNSKYIQLKEDYDWLEEHSIDCWNKLRILDTECWDPTDCIENRELEGCSKMDCNTCCFGTCTVMGCDWGGVLK